MKLGDQVNYYGTIGKIVGYGFRGINKSGLILGFMSIPNNKNISCENSFNEYSSLNDYDWIKEKLKYKKYKAVWIKDVVQL